MSRARVTALALVNWKGVFFERYLLDRHVTALEGANGAGKTTVMIAAYVVLLPDMTRLRFTNLGESGATGGDRGIWGRLGEPGRPAYSALELDLGGERLLLGVCLTRTTEPTVEPTAFLVSSLSESVRLSELLLMRREDGDHVPELAELKAQVARVGGNIQVFRTTKDYFAALFERGITPLRLTGEEERNKWNDMLRTSMTGGISRALGTEIRAFLLREESGLSDTLSRMRDNLESCRRTRLEVFESRQLEREISAIYEAGLAMFSAALHAERSAGIEAKQRIRDADEAYERAQLQQSGLAEEAAQLAQQEAELARRDELLRAEASQLEAAKQRREAASQLAARLAGLDAELAAAERQVQAAQAVQRDRALERDAAKEARARSLEAYDRASLGLSNLQQGLAELARRAHAHHELSRCLREARELLGRPELELDAVSSALLELSQARGEAEAEHASLARQGRDLDARREEHAAALAALQALSDSQLLAQSASAADADRRAQRAGSSESLASGAGSGKSELLASGACTIASDHLAPRTGAGDAAAAPSGAAAAPNTGVAADGSGAAACAGAALAPGIRAANAARDPAGSVSTCGDHARARALLARYAELEAGSARLEQLAQEQRDAQRLAVRQKAARALWASLEPAQAEPDDPAIVSELLSQLEREQQAQEALLHPNVDALSERQQLAELRRQHAELDKRAACYRLAQEAAERLQNSGIEVPGDAQAALLSLRDRLLGEQLALSARRDAIEAEREHLQAQAAELNRGGAVYDAELLRVRDELGAELFATRFEDLEPAQASWLQARLGPWVDALVVDDTEAAARALSKLTHGLDSVHLVSGGHSLELQAPEHVTAEAVVTEEPYGIRVSKLPQSPSLGRRAREAKLHALRAAIAAQTSALEHNAADMQRNAGQRRDADALWTHAELWLAGDPARHGQRLEAELAELEQQARRRQQAEQTARSRAVGLRARAEGLRRLLPEAQLLLPPDYAQRAQQLEAALGAARRARSELSRLTTARETLSRLLDVLRHPPPDDASLAEQAERVVQLEAQLDRVFRARSALEGALSLRHASDFGDAQAALDAQAELSPALEQQQKRARSQLQASEEAHNSALSAWEAATERLQAAQAAKSALAAQRERNAAELYELGGAISEQAAEAADQQLMAAQAELLRLADLARQCVAARALADERRARAEGEVLAARARQRAHSAEAEPIERAWRELREAAQGAGVLHAALSMAPAVELGSVQLRAEAGSKRELLLDRVSRARGGEELANTIRASERELDSWQAVRAWLGKRVPAQIAEVADPLLALERLRDHLDTLEARLHRQEGDLRGSSEDVARGIDVQLRRAHGQVRRLNQHLEGIRFGSIHGIRIEMRRIERMEQILRALREGHAQELLFSSSLPIEEALDEIFKRYGGGGKSGGQRLLDYREYVELVVEIRRQSAEAWEPANPTRLSTGEAIGVGAALMMVVLTEWERDANLLGPRNKLGSVRFLFLDEANRLSRDNLGVLFDLCRTLDLQLLVAAPEVARAQGNTTYRLVRHTTAEGREEVIVSGRRAVPAGDDADHDSGDNPAIPEHADPADPAQLRARPKDDAAKDEAAKDEAEPTTPSSSESGPGLLDFGDR